MLGKLLKHEFRATSRVMLPVLGVLLLTSVLAGLSIRLLDTGHIATMMRIVARLFIAAFVIGVITAIVISIVLMVNRFYRNLLCDEGYLMHTLPSNAHALVWSKLIVSLCWFIVTSLVIYLAVFFMTLFLGALQTVNFSDVAEDWKQTLAFLQEEGVGRGQLWLLLLEFLAAALLSMLACCLHFYAAMSLGHMAPNRKVLFSVLAFIGISIAFRIILSGVAAGMIQSGAMETFFLGLEEAPGISEAFSMLHKIALGTLLLSLIQSAVLYVPTVFGLKKGLNLG